MIIIVVLANFNQLAAQGKAFFQPNDTQSNLMASTATV
jgi:hypothetical protein